MKISKLMLVVPCLSATLLLGSALAQNKSGNHSGNMANSNTPVAGVTPIGITVEEQMLVANGWSLKKHMLGKPLYNDSNQRLGTVEDIIVAPDKAISYAIVGVGGFLGIDRHDVAVPISQIKISNDRLTLPGASKDAVKAMPEFHYVK